MPLDDAHIMQRVQDGQFELFDELVLRYRGPLLRVAESKLGERAWAEDVVQETFLAVFAARHTFDQRFAFRTWLWTILLNLCRRQLKRARRTPRQWTRSALASSPERVPEPASPETGLTQALLLERSRLVAALLDELPEPQADALRLRFYGGLKFEEIAETMHSSRSAAKQRVRKGLLALGERLKNDDQLRDDVEETT
ncbi:MAG: RNA polymerase sigma factor [Planctomycetaceae bacterium]